jgi:dTDP-4-dehydrorhamnose reductase
MTNLQPTNIRPALEMWGGVECSYVRVGDRIMDQFTRNGHGRRIEDLERFAELGLKALRFPVIWERHTHAGQIDWSWPDRWLTRARELGLRPIVGLIHHGSGALPGGLVDPGFVTGLANYAREVARRYPWVEAFTPVNEPATTARFSGLYGFWHPHGRSMECFARCFMNECSGTRAAMKAIREITPQAQLIQTEDLGKTHSTPLLAYQAEFENERRWLTFDLLCGRLTRDRILIRDYLRHAGISDAELDSFVDDPCPPDVLGMNHYVTSERFLDERMERYPTRTHGGNGRHTYADVSAVRVRAEGPVGPAGLMRELWERYRRPIAITEVQLACTREEQVRWLLEVWQAAKTLRSEGAAILAVTPWALLGSFDWDSLLTEPRGSYENGAFDVRGPKPRPTMIAHAIHALSHGQEFAHPALHVPGWWRRPIRHAYTPVSAPTTGPGTGVAESAGVPGHAAPLVVIGANGTLGQAMLRQCEIRGLPAVGLRRAELDITDSAAVQRVLGEISPWAVINCAGYVRVDDAEHDPAACAAQNTAAAEQIARTCTEIGAKLATFSTDLVFDGRKSKPYVESDQPHPLNEYGRTKLAAEQRVASANPDALIVRTSAFFGPWDDYNFVTLTLRDLAAGRRIRASAEHTVSPTYVPDLANAALDLVLDNERGIWHLANQGYVTWFEWARVLAELTEFSPDLVEPATAEQLGWTATRPAFSALGTERGALLASWERALERYLLATPELRAQAAA